MDKDSQEQAFLYRLSLKLTTEETNALVNICNLPARLRDQSAFDVILHLQMERKYKKLEEFASILKSINRKDLAKEVTTYAKKSQKNKSQSESTTKPAHFDCTLQVTMCTLQLNILKDQIDKLWKTTNDAGYGQIGETLQDDVKSHSEEITMKLQLVSKLLTGKRDAKNMSPSSSTSSASSEEANASVATASCLESEIQKKPKQLKSPTLERRSLPGSPCQKPKQPMFPPTKKSPFSAIQCTDDHVSGTGMTINSLMATPPLPSLRELQESPLQTKLQCNKPTPAPKPKPKPKPKPSVSARSQSPSVVARQNRSEQPVNEAPYDEVTYNGTGDSGFAEASEFLRPELRRELPVQLPSAQNQQPGEYAGLNKPTIEPPGYYKTPLQEVKKDSQKDDDDAEYENVMFP